MELLVFTEAAGETDQSYYALRALTHGLTALVFMLLMLKNKLM